MIHYLVHDSEHDDVGVAVVDVKAGQDLQGRDLATNKTLSAKSLMDVPLGHKIALRDFDVGEVVTK